MSQDEVTVVCIKAASNHYYLTNAGRWAADPRMARKFIYLDEAEAEADRIGPIIFMRDTCVPNAAIVRISRNRRMKEGPSVIESWVVTSIAPTGNEWGVVAHVSVVFKGAIEISFIEIVREPSKTYEVRLPEWVQLQEPSFKEMVRVIRETLDSTDNL